MMLAGTRVLVTGGTGFIGGRLVEKLVVEQGARVRVLVRRVNRAARIARLPVEMVHGDLLDVAAVRKAVRGCDVVFHAAYDFAGTRSRRKRIGIRGTRHLCEAVLGERARRMVHVSTFSVYAPASDGELTESSPWPRCNDSYVLIKREAEHLVLGLHRRQGLPVVVVQPTLVYGPFSKHWTLAPVEALKTGMVPLVNGGGGYCNAVYVDDVADAMMLAATQPDVVGQTFLISAAEPVTWKEFYGAYEAVLGMRATLDLSEEELRGIQRARPRAPSVISQVARAVRQPAVLRGIARAPRIQKALSALKESLSDEQWGVLKARVLGNGPHDAGGKNGSRGRIVHLPDPLLLALYRSRTRVSIEKARRRLGYVPQFDFARGMDLTGAFIRWAALA